MKDSNFVKTIDKALDKANIEGNKKNGWSNRKTTKRKMAYS